MAEMASSIQPQFNGRLGKVSSALVNKVVGGKMAGGLGLSQVKQYLSSAYGLGPLRIEGSLLYSLLDEPPSRLGTEAQSKAWLDKIAKSYGVLKGIQFFSAPSASQSGRISSAVINSKDFVDFKQRLDQMVSKQFIASSKYLGFDPLGPGKTNRINEEALKKLQSRMDIISSEHGDIYLDGIAPQFDALKSRSFDSFWNWAHQDLALAFEALLSDKITILNKQLIHRIVDGGDERLINVIAYFVQVAKKKEHQLATASMTQLLEMVTHAQKSNPVFRLGIFLD